MNPYKITAISTILALAIIAALESLPKPKASAGTMFYADMLNAPVYPPGMANRYVERRQLYILAANSRKAETASN